MSFSNLSRRLSRTQKLSTGSLVNGEDASVTTAIELQNHQGKANRQENRRLVGHFYDMKNRFWAVGCGLGWAVGKKVWADYEQLLIGFLNFLSAKKKKRKKNIAASALKNCIKKR